MCFGRIGRTYYLDVNSSNPTVDVEAFVASEVNVCKYARRHSQQTIAITVNGSRATNVNAAVIY